MAVVIDEIQTDVQVQGAGQPAPQRPEEPPPWQQLAQLRAAQQQLLCDDSRTAACGNID